jgi:phosphoribosylglycinamide formyltransferase 2
MLKAGSPTQRCKKSRDIYKAVTDNPGGQGVWGRKLFVKSDDVWFSERSARARTDTGMW